MFSILTKTDMKCLPSQVGLLHKVHAKLQFRIETKECILLDCGLWSTWRMCSIHKPNTTLQICDSSCFTKGIRVRSECEWQALFVWTTKRPEKPKVKLNCKSKTCRGVYPCKQSMHSNGNAGKDAVTSKVQWWRLYKFTFLIEPPFGESFAFIMWHHSTGLKIADFQN